ncbi:MAG: hypothetical protein KQH67_03535 [Bacteroidetes bacterium]|nr:hypothetical protein [Bacteroidota bacterium]
MKRKYTLLVILLFIGAEVTFAQLSDKDWKYIVVREDVVKPSMTNDYEASLTDLRSFLMENKVHGVKYITQLQDNLHYTHITTVKKLGEFDEGLSAYIRGDKKSAEFDLIWSDLNETIESYSYYVVKYEDDLSYVPDDKVWLEDAPYRRWNYFYFQPGTEKEVQKLISAWKNLYEDKGISNGFRVYTGVIGIERPVIIFTTWAKNPRDFQENIQKNIELLGEEGTILWMAMMQLVRKVETVEGWYLPQYSFVPE